MTKRDQVCTDLTAKVHGQLGSLFSQTTATHRRHHPEPVRHRVLDATAHRRRRPHQRGGGDRQGHGLPPHHDRAGPIRRHAGRAQHGGPRRQERRRARGRRRRRPSRATPRRRSVNLTDTRCSATVAPTTPSSHQTSDTSQAGFTCSPSGPAPTLMTLGGDRRVDVGPRAPTSPRRSPARPAAAWPCCATPPPARAPPPTTSSTPTPRPTPVARRSTRGRPRSPPVRMETPDSGGRASLTLWSSTADGAQGPGRLCVTLRRASNGAVLGSTGLQARQLAERAHRAHDGVRPRPRLDPERRAAAADAPRPGRTPAATSASSTTTRSTRARWPSR